MKQVIAVALATLFMGSNAYALSEMNCSNADGSIQRIEEEVWGANDIRWLVDGEEVSAQSVVFDRSDSIMIAGSRESDPNGPALLGGGFSTFVARVQIEGDNPRGDFVICHHWWNAALD